MWEGCSLPTVATQQVRFGPFVLDAHAGELFKHGIRLKLQGHPIQILAMLLERPGELITREEIQQKLWPNESGTFVDFAHGLNTAVRKLRQALGDEAETPQYVETLPRRGYRFVGQLSEMADLDPGWRSGIRKNAHAPDITAANATKWAARDSARIVENEADVISSFHRPATVGRSVGSRTLDVTRQVEDFLAFAGRCYEADHLRRHGG